MSKLTIDDIKSAIQSLDRLNITEELLTKFVMKHVDNYSDELDTIIVPSSSRIPEGEYGRWKIIPTKHADCVYVLSMKLLSNPFSNHKEKE